MLLNSPPQPRQFSVGPHFYSELTQLARARLRTKIGTSWHLNEQKIRKFSGLKELFAFNR